MPAFIFSIAVAAGGCVGLGERTASAPLPTALGNQLVRCGDALGDACMLGASVLYAAQELHCEREFARLGDLGGAEIDLTQTPREALPKPDRAATQNVCLFAFALRSDDQPQFTACAPLTPISIGEVDEALCEWRARRDPPWSVECVRLYWAPSDDCNPAIVAEMALRVVAHPEGLHVACEGVRYIEVDTLR